MVWVVEYKIDGGYWQEEDYCAELEYALKVYYKAVENYSKDKKN